MSSRRRRDDRPFWEVKTLSEMTKIEWESLCDQCGRCCLLKLEDEDTGQIILTGVACRLLDPDSCRCSNYAKRRVHVPDCVVLTPESTPQLRWLPETCAYRLVANRQPLPWWHPLVSGRAETVHEAGISVRGTTISESEIEEDQLERYIIPDYGERPRRLRRKASKARPARARRGSR